MKNYIGSKIIKGTPMSNHEFLKSQGREVEMDQVEDADGYQVIYPGTAHNPEYVSWSPKEAFETAYREVTPEEAKFING